jgi:hypothetical protein
MDKPLSQADKPIIAVCGATGYYVFFFTLYDKEPLTNPVVT